ncbi:serine/threonine-protein kinase [Ruegeria lacuscaerulensis]|uniref:serine/threonine-protein kinase n=1 Tax=Ruegeria lacuscaerulensis TaxID=55218 RepID=UPI00147F996A|nr:protein kinase [Ruegeria lacuscaerulensis]
MREIFVGIGFVLRQTLLQLVEITKLAKPLMNKSSKIEFNRPTKYTLLEVLGNGACGETVHLRDEGMDADFVAKKYLPIIAEKDDPDLFSELLGRFRDEARILFRLNHPNIVRVFNYFDYSEYKTSYILMEYVSGTELLDYLKQYPAKADRVFEGVVDGFAHLQSRGILHRDIRPANILIEETGTPKIIDFGFGKEIDIGKSGDDRKSISLNWWCETPPEFSDAKYDFQTEVYFVGKLFQLAIQECGLSDFKYRLLLISMCNPDRASRTASFEDVKRSINEGKFSELAFSEGEIGTYRSFAKALSEVVSSIQSDARFDREPAKVLNKLEELYRKTMLEETLAAPNKLVSVFVLGSFRFWTSTEVEVETLLKFIELMRGLSEEKRSIVLENLILRLEACERTEPKIDYDDIPF